MRVDRYDGLTTNTLVQPRIGLSYAVPGTNSVLRASYGRTLETPYNENLLLSSGIGLNGVFGDGQILEPGRRNQGEFGIQQGLGSAVVLDFGYFVKRTHNAYDFGVLFDTPIVFPISWDHSKIDGFTGRINIVERKGFSAFVVMAHTNAIYSPPGNGGILVDTGGGDFRIDHDQKFNSTANFQYTFNKAHGAWGGAQLAVRLGPRGRVRRQHRRRARAVGRPAGRHRVLLRRQGRDGRQPDHELCLRRGRHPSPHPGGRDRRRRDEPAAHRAAPPRGPGLRR